MGARIFSLMGEIYMNTTKVEAAIKGTKTKAKDLTTTLDKVGKKAGEVGNKLSFALTAPLVALGSFSVKMGMEYEASLQQVNRTLGESADRITEFANKNALAFNMSKNSAIKYGAVYSNLLSSFIADTDETATQTEKLLKASAVISSSTGRTIEDVMDRIRSGLLGNTEAIEDLGVNVNVALLESTDAFKQFAGDKSWDQLDFATQQQIRLFGILEQTTKKYGDEVASNTSSKTQQLTAKFENLKLTLGTELLPVFNQLLEKLTKVVTWFTSLDSGTQQSIIQLGLFAAALGPLLIVLGNAIKLFKGLSTAVLFIATPVGSLIAAISLLVAVFGYAVFQIVKHWDTIKEVLAAMWGTVKDVFSKIGNFISNIFKGIVNTVIWSVNKAIELINNMIKLALSPLNLLIKGLNLIPGVKIPSLKIEIPQIPKLAKGLDYVPYDEFPAILHKGERVLTAKENNDYNKGVSNYFNIENLNVRDDKDIERIAEELYYLQKRSVA